MKVNLGPGDYHEQFFFVWSAAGAGGGPAAAFVIDGRDYADDKQARAAIRDILKQADWRMRVADYESALMTEANKKELAYWPGWAEFRSFLDIYGPVYPFRRLSAEEKAKKAASAAASARVAADQAEVSADPQAPLLPVYDNLHYECWGQLVELFPRGERRYDAVLGYEVPGRGLNGYTGEFEGHTKRVLQLVSGGEDDETWPLRDEEEFIEHVEDRREKRLRRSFFQRNDKPEIFAAYERAASEGKAAESRRATYEMWSQVQRRRAHFLVDDDPVRVTLSDDGTPVMAWRLDNATGRIIETSRTDAETVVDGDAKRVTEYVWLLAIEERRLALGLDVDGAIADEYVKANAEADDAYRRLILIKTFDLWAEKFATDNAERGK